MSKHKNIFANVYTTIWSEKVFVNKNLKEFVPWTYFLQDLNGGKIVGMFHQKEL